MEEKVLDNASLLEIIRVINIGLMDFDNFNKLKIISDKKPGIIIKVNQDLVRSELLTQIIQDLGLTAKDLKIEFEYTDFLVFGLSDDKQTLTTIPLMDIICSEGMVIDKETGSDVSGGWSINAKEWTLVEVKN